MRARPSALPNESATTVLRYNLQAVVARGQSFCRRLTQTAVNGRTCGGRTILSVRPRIHPNVGLGASEGRASVFAWRTPPSTADGQDCPSSTHPAANTPECHPRGVLSEERA